MRDIINVILFIGVCALIIFFNTPKGKGILGEYKVRRVLGRTKVGKKYVINNVTVVNEGKSSQIDHILINLKGIFVIETKNYSGQIYGQEHQGEWTQVLAYGKVKNKLYNPIMQNKTHVYALSKIINRSDCFIPLVVFNKAELKTPISDVINLRDLRRRIRLEKNEIFTPEDIALLYETIKEFKKKPQVTNKEHVASIKKMKTNLENNICPRCSGQLVEKVGKHGTFMDCSNYPQCKFIKKKF